jgi:hypothetical protein
MKPVLNNLTFTGEPVTGRNYSLIIKVLLENDKKGFGLERFAKPSLERSIDSTKASINRTWLSGLIVSSKLEQFADVKYLCMLHVKYEKSSF